MTDLISRQAAIEVAHRTIFDFFCIVEDDSESPITESDKRLLELNKAITTAIRGLPTIEPKRGKWYEMIDRRFGGQVVCSECGETFWGWMRQFHYCPNCGAQMERSEE